MRYPRPLPATALLIVTAATAVTGCAGDHTPHATPGGTRESGLIAGATAVVIVDDRDYRPGDVEISVGETVGWSFQDNLDHDIAFHDGPASPVQRAGTWTRTFDETGTYDYLCTLHPSMTGTVTVSS